MSNTLSQYITDAQRLLHDATFRFWSQTELTDYANKARRKVAAETGCTRQLILAVPVIQNVNTFSNLTLLANRRVIGILDIYLFYSSTTRYALRYFPYSQYARMGGVVYSYQGTPVIWSQIGGTSFINPIPSQGYTADFDCSIEPLDLVNLTDIDNEVQSPFSECVKFYMCYLAKLKDQRRQEANDFMGDYIVERNSVASSTMIRKLVGR